MVKFCSKCGNELKNENDKFCDKCGAEVLENKNKSNTGNTTGTTIICPHCSQATPMGQTICAKCGVSLEDNTTAVIVSYIVTSLLGIIGIIPGIYLLTRNNGKVKTQGIIIIGISIIWILNFIFSFWQTLLIIILLIVMGILFWFNDVSIF